MTDTPKVRALFERARNLPPEQHLAFVLREAGDDADLANGVLSLLANATTRQTDPDAVQDRVSLSGEAEGESVVLDAIKNRTAPVLRYRHVKEIASGGMGKVSQVRDVDLRRQLAMKVMLDENSGQLPRFIEEAQVMGQLDHPNIVPVHELGIDADGRVFFTMKLVKGETLRDVFDKVTSGDDGWNVTRALSVILRVCEAMAFAHSKGVLHRDIKPANIMVGRFGEVYVMDWGLARVLGQRDAHDLRLKPDESLSVVRTERRDKGSSAPDSPLITMDGTVVGTPAFMPPEQAEGRLDIIGPHSDVYAIGALLYRLLSGLEPYGEPGSRLTGKQVLNRVIAGPPQRVHELAKDVPAELLAIQEKAMARKIAERYPSMNALADDLRAYLEHRVVGAYETGAIAELKKWVERNKGLAAAAGLIVLVLAGATAVVTKQKREVEAKNVEVTQQKSFAEARKAEFDQLAGKVYLERAIEREKDLYPPWPEKIEAMERWLAEDVKRLLDLKPTLESTLADLRARALPLTDEQQARERDRTTHPKFAELESLRPRLAWLRSRMAALAATSPSPLPALTADLEARTARELNDFAQPRVDPDFTKRVFGEEPLALAAARRAVEKCEAGDEVALLAWPLDTLAWAYFANGLDTEAREASARALEAAPADKKAEFTTYSENLEKAIAAHSGKAGTKLLGDLEAQVSVLDAAVNARRTFTFALETETFLYITLSDLAASIAAFESGAKADVEQRLTWAKQIGDLTLRHPNARVTWDEARAAIAKADDIVASQLYAQSPGGAIDLKPQTGLVPIGMNPVTKLWEFYELRSACDLLAGQDPATIEIPSHREDGSIEVKDGTGIVFVLLPGGTFLQGAQKSDPNAANYDPLAESDERPQEVALSPFFLARHELTRAQWYRLSKGDEPSTNKRGFSFPNDPAITWTHPVESVDWTMCRDLLVRHGLTLPTEARWEYGARGLTTTVWWTGDEAASLAGAANVLDVRAEAAIPAWGRQVGDFDDGFIGSCRVGSLRANPFGLFDVHGNVWEWCLDAYASLYGKALPGDGLRAADAESSSRRVIRGGSCANLASGAGSASRHWLVPAVRYDVLGARPSRILDLAP